MNPLAIEIADESAPSTTSTNIVADADGFYAADGIVGVPSLTLRASALLFTPLDREWTIDSTGPWPRLRFRLKP